MGKPGLPVVLQSSRVMAALFRRHLPRAAVHSVLHTITTATQGKGHWSKQSVQLLQHVCAASLPASIDRQLHLDMCMGSGSSQSSSGTKHWETT